MADDALVVIPLPTQTGAVTYGMARLVFEADKAFAEAIAPVPGTSFAPPGRIALSRYGLARVRPGAAQRPDLFVYEGMILPPPAGST